MIKASAAPDYIYQAAMGGWQWCFFISTQLPFSFGQKGYFLAYVRFPPLKIGMSQLQTMYWQIDGVSEHRFQTSGTQNGQKLTSKHLLFCHPSMQRTS